MDQLSSSLFIDQHVVGEDPSDADGSEGFLV